MILSESDAAYAADQFIDYFSNMGRIDEYLRNVKLDRMSKMPTYLPGCGPEEDMFDDFDIPVSYTHLTLPTTPYV